MSLAVVATGVWNTQLQLQIEYAQNAMLIFDIVENDSQNKLGRPKFLINSVKFL